MKKILQIFVSDLRGIFKNRITLIIICGLLILPSFYAWFNIYASWDPYNNTNGIKVAVSNEDVGATLLGNDVNIGKNLEENLNEEDSLGWFFVDNEEKAIELARSGEVYASIVIPEDFSAKMVTLLNENPIKPSLEYYVNEKINAISPKITDRGASALQSEIGDAFVESLTEEVFATLDRVDITTEDISETFDSYKGYLDDLIEEIPTIIERLNSVASTVESGSEIVALSVEDIDLITKTLDDSISFSDDVRNDVSKLNGDADEFSADLVETLNLTKVSLEDLDRNIVSLRERIISDKPDVVEMLGGSSDDLRTIAKDIKTIQTSLDGFDDKIFVQTDALGAIIDGQFDELDGLLGSMEGVDLNDDRVNYTLYSIVSLNDSIVSNLSDLVSQLKVIQTSLGESGEQYDILTVVVESAMENINRAIYGIKKINMSYDSAYDAINEFDKFASNIDGYIVSLQKDILKIRGHIGTIYDLLKNESNYLVPLVGDVVDVSVGRLNDVSFRLNNLSEEIEDKNSAEITLDNIHNLNLNTISNLDSLIIKLDTDLTVSAKKYLSGISNFSSDINVLLLSVEDKTPFMEDFLQKLSSGGEVAAKDMIELAEKLPELQTDLIKVSERMDKFDEKVDIEKFSDAIISNKNVVSDFIAYPVNLDTHILYPVEHYGVSMTPFYTALSLWVGILVLAGLLTIKARNVDFKSTPLEKYLGKFLFFVTLAVIQGLIVSLGDLFLLKVSMAEPVLFVFLTMLQSLVFCTILYTLICLFGNIGKALGVVLLVLQVAGAGGTFPIEMNPIFFQKLYQWLPFTYGIGALREAVSGVFYPVLVRDVTMLIIYFIVFLAIGILFVSRAHGRIEKLANNFDDSKLGD